MGAMPAKIQPMRYTDHVPDTPSPALCAKYRSGGLQLLHKAKNNPTVGTDKGLDTFVVRGEDGLKHPVIRDMGPFPRILLRVLRCWYIGPYKKLVALSAPDLLASELPLGRRGVCRSSRMPSLGDIEYARHGGKN
jgi:hypothetical protein